MKGFIAALYVETYKALKSKMLWGTIIFFAFISFMLGFLMLVAKHPEIAGNSAILSTKASFISKADWHGFFGLMLQMALTLGLVGPAIVTIWVFGREYSDRVIKDMLALPVSRVNIVLAKFVISFIWSLLLMAILFVFGVLAGLAVHLDGWSSQLVLKNLRIFSVSSLLTILLFPVVSLITCVSRGYLLPVGVTILLLIATQFMFLGVPSITPYIPWAVPGLTSGVAGPFSPKPEMISYVILALTTIIGISGTAVYWRYVDQH
ncbi:MAG: ABC transporter permease [Bacteroidales bacterium]